MDILFSEMAFANMVGMDVVAFDRERYDFTEMNYYTIPGRGDVKAEIPSEFYYDAAYIGIQPDAVFSAAHL